MATVFKYREGSTDPISITLYNGTTPADITGYGSVSFFLRSTDNSVQSEASTTDSGITVTTASAGAIVLHPNLLTSALLFSKVAYLGYVIVVDGTGKRSDFPGGDGFVFKMYERFTGDG